jgi:hypothetical protein
VYSIPPDKFPIFIGMIQVLLNPDELSFGSPVRKTVLIRSTSKYSIPPVGALRSSPSISTAIVAVIDKTELGDSASRPIAVMSPDSSDISIQ